MSTPALPEKAALAQPAEPQSVPHHLKCNSCSKPVYNSFQTPHGCRLCHTCVSTKLHPSEKRSCPGTTEACKDEQEEILISQTSCFPDMATRREIAKLTVTCPNRDDGCTEKLKWKDVDSHLDKCDYEKVSCEQCRDSILKKRLKLHLSDECRQRRVKCNDCSLTVVFSEMEKSHKNLDSATCCSAFTAHCPYCKDRSKPKLNRPAFIEHLRTCPEKPNECKYSHLGCDKKFRKSDMEKHFREDADHHISLLDQKLRQLGAASVSSSSPGAAGGSSTPSSGVSGDTREIEEAKRKVNNIHDHFKKLQVNVANWAHTTLEFEQMADKFGGVSQMRVFLKNLDDKVRQLETAGDAGRRGGGGGSGTSDADSSVVQQKLNEIEFRLQNLESTNYDGLLVWKVNNLTKRRREAVDKRVLSIFSQPFFNRHYGFMFRVRLFLNGNESGDSSHVSVYLVLMQHDFDEIQEWPLRASVTFKLLNLKNRSDDITKSVRFDSGSQRPSSREDLSVSCGDAKFVSISQLETSERFVKNDCLFLEVEVSETESGAGRRSRKK